MASKSSIILTKMDEKSSKFVRGLAGVGRRYKKTDIEEKLEFLYRVTDEDSVMYQGGDSLSDLVSKDLISLYELCLKYDQTEFPRTFTNGAYTYATRVFKVYAYVEPWDMKNIEHVFFNGMYWPLQGAFLSRSVMNNYFDKCYGWSDPKAQKHAMTPDEIAELGLPDNLNYLQINRLQNGMGFALRTDVWENGFIRSRNCFVPLNLNAQS